MTLERGTPQNGAWRAVLAGFGSGCHRYWFAFRDSAGTLVTWPTTGSLGIGDASCADWSSERPALAEGCETLQACDPGAAAACDDGNPCTVDACQAGTGCSHAPASVATECSDGLTCNGAEHCDGAGACAAGGTCDTTPANPGSSGCSCGGEAGPSGIALALAGLLAARRSRRQFSRQPAASRLPFA
jgi:MYXO-CTERM domain-containing protein